jgi:GGDEF domain-containing protein
VSPKLGEIVAFRNVVPSIPTETAVDEISIQALISQLGYRLVYEPDAVVYNHGPTTVSDFLRQRRRIYAGHLRVRRQQAYEASTMSLRRVGRALIGSGSFASPGAAMWTIGAIGLEACARGLGLYDHLRHRSHHIWETALTTKQHIEGAEVQGQKSVLVFNIVNFHRVRLELGLRTSRLLTQMITQRIQCELGPGPTVANQQSGTIVVILAADREQAERMAHKLVDDLEHDQLRPGHRRDGVSVRVACGIIAFSQSGQPLAESIPASTPPEIKHVMAG